MRYKPGKKHIIPDALSKLASVNNIFHYNEYSKLNSLFAYHTSLMEINPNLVKSILDRYAADSW